MGGLHRIGRYARVVVALAVMLLPAVAIADEAPFFPTKHDIRPVLLGSTVPGLTLTDVDGEPFDLGEAFADRRTILVLYRGGW